MKKRTEETRQVSIHMPVDLHRALKIRAARENRSVSNIVINAIKKDRPERVPPTQGETANEAHEART